MKLNTSGLRRVDPIGSWKERGTQDAPSNRHELVHELAGSGPGLIRIVTPTRGPSLRTLMTGTATTINRAFHSVAFGWTHVAEGETESKAIILNEADSRVARSLPQHVRVEFTTANGTVVTMVDAAEQTRDGRWSLITYKREWDDFDKPKARAQTRLTELAATALGVAVERRTLKSLGSKAFKDNATDIVAHRFTPVTERQRFIVLEAIARDGWISFGDVLDLLGEDPRQARAVACSMIVRRVIDVNITTRPLTDDTPVRAMHIPNNLPPLIARTVS